MKNLVILILLGIAVYFAWHRISGNVSAAANPVYVEFRVEYPDDIELVGFGRMDSKQDCDARAAKFWRKALASDTQAKITAVRCGVQLPPRHQALFDDKTSTATYIALDRGNIFERDARLLIYGVPSSEVMKICPELLEKIKRNYGGQIKCIKGSIG